MIEAALTLEQGPGSAEEKIRKALNGLLQSIGSNESFGLSVLLIGQASVSADVPEDGTVLSGDPGEMALMFWVSVKGLGMHKAGLGESYFGPSAELILRMFMK